MRMALDEKIELETRKALRVIEDGAPDATVGMEERAGSPEPSAGHPCK